MARRSGFLVALERAARESARQQRLAAAAQQRQAKEQLRYEREHLRLRMQLDKAEKLEYVANRATEAEDQTAEVQEIAGALRGVLQATLGVDDTISFDSLRKEENRQRFVPPKEVTKVGAAPRREDFTGRVRPGTWFEGLFSNRSRYEREMREAENKFQAAFAEYQTGERTRIEKLIELEEKHDCLEDKRLQLIKGENLEIDDLQRAYDEGEAHAVVTYCSMVLEQSLYPDGFPQAFRLAYVPDSKELVVDYELPTAGVVPLAAEFRYVKVKDAIEPKPRKPAEIREIYQDVVAAVALRTIHELFEADQRSHLAVVVFNGFVNTVDLATGQDIKPYLISVRTTRDRFLELDLARIDKRACLRNLGAQVSPHPTELQPVKPLIEFDMVDKRFVEGADVLSDLESRPNLMDLTPFEFEQLVGNLFSKMGLETKQTRSARDGGIDVVAFDTRPVIGGKVVIQAKRYRHTVGVAAVRDLFGTMNHEGANKGILISTSSYGPAAYDFIVGKPIELIDGGGLLYYLEHHAGIKARILFPEPM